MEESVARLLPEIETMQSRIIREMQESFFRDQEVIDVDQISH